MADKGSDVRIEANSFSHLPAFSPIVKTTSD